MIGISAYYKASEEFALQIFGRGRLGHSWDIPLCISFSVAFFLLLPFFSHLLLISAKWNVFHIISSFSLLCFFLTLSSILPLSVSLTLSHFLPLLMQGKCECLSGWLSECRCEQSGQQLCVSHSYAFLFMSIGFGVSIMYIYSVSPEKIQLKKFKKNMKNNKQTLLKR